MAKDKLLNHDSDGIQEYDNDLPKWWLYLFILTIIWGGIYIVYFHFSGNPLPVESLQAEMKAHNKKIAQKSSQGGDLSTYIGVAKHIEEGSKSYTLRCAVCHAPKGEGLVGPNLTDKFWIHGSSPEAIRQVIQDGVPSKGMLAWKGLLKSEEINQITAFIVTLKGTTPPNPKAPQGNPE